MPAELTHASFVALWNPDIIIASVALIAAYLIVVGPARRYFPGSAPVPRRKVVAYILAVVSFYLAIGSPLDFVSDNLLFSAHMVEHILLIFTLAPLLLLGVPDWLLRPVLLRPTVRKVFAKLTHPVVAVLLFNLVFGLWHFPGAYDLTLRDDTVHLIEHVTFVVVGLITWWPVLSPLPELPRLSDAVQMLYLFVDELAMTTLFALIVFAPKPMYTFYLHVPRMWGISPLADQQFGGQIMRIGSALSLGVAFTLAFIRWVRSQQKLDELERPRAQRAQRQAEKDKRIGA